MRYYPPCKWKLFKQRFALILYLSNFVIDVVFTAPFSDIAPLMTSIASINILSHSPISSWWGRHLPPPYSLCPWYVRSPSHFISICACVPSSTKHETLIFAPWKIVFKIGLSDARVCRGKIISIHAHRLRAPGQTHRAAPVGWYYIEASKFHHMFTSWPRRANFI